MSAGDALDDHPCWPGQTVQFRGDQYTVVRRSSPRPGLFFVHLYPNSPTAPEVRGPVPVDRLDRMMPWPVPEFASDAGLTAEEVRVLVDELDRWQLRFRTFIRPGSDDPDECAYLDQRLADLVDRLRRPRPASANEEAETD